jgi:hypothetical protein
VCGHFGYKVAVDEKLISSSKCCSVFARLAADRLLNRGRFVVEGDLNYALLRRKHKITCWH